MPTRPAAAPSTSPAAASAPAPASSPSPAAASSLAASPSPSPAAAGEGRGEGRSSPPSPLASPSSPSPSPSAPSPSAPSPLASPSAPSAPSPLASLSASAPDLESLRRRTLLASLKDGLGYSVMQGTGERFVQPFATWLGASEATWGVLTAASALAAGLFQVLGANVVDRTRRRNLWFVGGGVVQALSWGLVLAALALRGTAGVACLIASQILYLGAVNFTIPAWGSVMGDVVPADRRGRYFGVRNGLCWLAQLLSFTLAAVLLDQLRLTAHEPQGFALLFAVALLSRFVSVYYLTQMHEPAYAAQATDHFTLFDFLRRAPRANFARFALFVMVFSAGVGIAGPFFGYFVLRDLHWSYTEYMIWLNLQMVALAAAMPLWGWVADRWGNKLVLSLCSVGIGLIPFGWLASTGRGWLFGLNVYDGMVWGGWVLASGNYLFDAVTPAKRARCTAYCNLLANLGVLAGSLLGGWLEDRLAARPALFGVPVAVPFMALLVLSAVGRLGACLIGLPCFRELRVGGVVSAASMLATASVVAGSAAQSIPPAAPDAGAGGDQVA
ncbi:MAG: MFS transporter [Planctomycetes bacterium]|nr:MFS transporter [Planctomycetota bacterium]